MKAQPTPFVNSKAKTMYYIILQNNSRSALKNISKDILIQRLNTLCKMAYIAKKPPIVYKNVYKSNNTKKTQTKKREEMKRSTPRINVVRETPTQNVNHEIISLKLPFKISNLHTKMKMEKVPEQSVIRPRLTKFSHSKN